MENNKLNNTINKLIQNINKILKLLLQNNDYNSFEDPKNNSFSCLKLCLKASQ